MIILSDEVLAGRQCACALALMAFAALAVLTPADRNSGIECPQIEGVMEVSGGRSILCAAEVLSGLARLCADGRSGPGKGLSFSVRMGGCRMQSKRLAASTTLLLGFPLDVNDASMVELELVPGIGPKSARRIIEGRPYGRLSDLLRVHGIGKARLAKLKLWLVVTSSEEP